MMKIDIKNSNFKAIMNKKTCNKYSGNCIGLANGKIVVHDKSIKKVMAELLSKYKGQDISVATCPKKNRVFSSMI